MEHCPKCGGAVLPEHRFCPACAEPLTHRPRATDPFLSQVVGGSYLVRELIGEGGMGRVYKAEQVALGKSVAIKVIHSHLVGDESAVARFYTEAKASSRLNHPNCVAVIDFGKTEGGQLYLVMEYLRGHDLGRILSDEGALAPMRIAEICRQVCAALADAHELGIVHRDMKPDNVLVEPLRTGGDFVKVVDFGLAKIQAGPRDRPVTSAGIVCGTPEYMSPEQGRGDELDGRSDLYSLGVVLYECLTGTLPFTAESPTQVVLRHLTEAPQPPRERAPEREIPEELAAVVLKAMEKDRTVRYQSAEEMAAALDGWLSLARHQLSGRLCPSCGRVNPIAARFCAICGGRIVADSLPHGPTLIDLSRTSTAPEVHPPAAARGTTVPDLRLIGREKALGALLEFRETAKREGTVVLMVGEHGVGKRRLAEALLRKAADEGDLAVVTGPDPTWAHVAYHGARRLLAGLLGLRVEATPEAARAAAERMSLEVEALAGVNEIFSAKGLEELDPAARVRAAGHALRTAAERKAAERGVLVVIEDLHRCDPLSRQAFTALVRPPHVVNFLVVALQAQGFDPGWPDAKVLEIAGLPTSHARLMLARRAQGMTPPPSLPDAVEARDAIAPLYVDQLVRFIQEGGVNPPDALPDLVSARVGRLPHEARILLQCAAILGAASNVAELERVAGSEHPMGPALDILKDRAILIQEGEEVRFANPILADLVAAGIPASARKELHARAAEAFARRDAPIEVRAHHVQRTDGGFSALLLLERTGNQAARRGDREGAVTYFRRGLELARQEISRGEITEPEKPMLLFSAKLGRALLAAGEPLRADAVLSEALGMGLGGADERADLLSALSEVAAARGAHKAAVGHAKDAVHAGSRLPKAGSRAALQIGLGRMLLLSGDPAGASFALTEALGMLEEAAHSSREDRELRVEALLLVSECHTHRRLYDLATSAAKEALGLAEAAGLRGATGRCLLRLGHSAAAAGDAKTAWLRTKEAADVFEALGDGLAAHSAREEGRRLQASE